MGRAHAKNSALLSGIESCDELEVVGLGVDNSVFGHMFLMRTPSSAVYAINAEEDSETISLTHAEGRPYFGWIQLTCCGKGWPLW